ncbi:FAD/FMN-containing dehydrogenase [Rhizobium mongolense]
MRENVLSLTVVLPTGQVIRTGGRARKSSAGYDLTRLFVGSEGTLGIITDVTLRLQGVPETISAALCSFESVEQAVGAAIAIVQLAIPIARMELMDRGLIAAANSYSGLSLKIEDTLAFEFHGSPASVQEQVELVADIVKDHGGKDFEWANAPEERNRLWKARHNAFYAVVSQRQNAKGWSSDVCVPVSELSGCILRTRALLQDCSVPAAILGHVGDGNYHVVFAVNPENKAELAEVAAINKTMVEHAISVGGTSTGETWRRHRQDRLSASGTRRRRRADGLAEASHRSPGHHEPRQDPAGVSVADLSALVHGRRCDGRLQQLSLGRILWTASGRSPRNPSASRRPPPISPARQPARNRS